MVAIINTGRKYITASRLKNEFGWTERLIKLHLGNHDREATNPHQPLGHPMRLFLIQRVNQQYDKHELRQELEANRRERNWNPTNAVHTDDQVIEAANASNPQISHLPDITVPELIVIAIQQHQDRTPADHGIAAHQTAIPSGRAEEMAVNMIRHEYTNYDHLLIDCPRSENHQVNRQAYVIIKNRVHQRIAQQLPELAAACRRLHNNIPTSPFPDSAFPDRAYLDQWLTEISTPACYPTAVF